MLSRHQSRARFAVVVGVEVSSLLVCFAPLRGQGAAWQADCYRVGAVATIAAFAAIGLTFFLDYIWPKNRPKVVIDRQLNLLMELSIVLLYIINAISLASIVARTGGPAASLYAPLIPIQLSGIIFLQIGKETLLLQAGKKGLARVTSLMLLFYTLVASSALLSAHWKSDLYYSIWGFTHGQRLPDFSSWNASLTIAGMLLAFLIYWLPRQEKLIDLVNRLYPSEASDKAQPFSP